MITPAYARLMARYNQEMNARFYAAAGRLSEEARRQERGAFWHSIHGTLSHLLWADRMWMSRFDGWAPPAQALAESDRVCSDFDVMLRLRADDDARLIAWCDRLDETWLQADQNWFSGATGREMSMPRTILLAHLFNHQAHHRGQVHAMLTAAGEGTGATDLPFVLSML